MLIYSGTAEKKKRGIKTMLIDSSNWDARSVEKKGRADQQQKDLKESTARNGRNQTKPRKNERIWKGKKRMPRRKMERRKERNKSQEIGGKGDL